MTNLLQRIKDFSQNSKEKFIVDALPISKVRQEMLENFLEEEVEHANYLISVNAENQAYSLERVLLDLEILYEVNRDDKNGEYIYTFLDYYEEYNEFTYERAMKTYNEFCNQNKELYTKIYFGFSFFEKLKEKEIIPYNYELYVTTRIPEDGWEQAKHYVLYDGNRPILSISIDAFSNEDTYEVNKNSIDDWVSSLFKEIEKNEKRT